MVCGKEAQYCQISQSDCVTEIPGGGTKILYYIHQTPLSSWRVEGGRGSLDETNHHLTYGTLMTYEDPKQHTDEYL